MGTYFKNPKQKTEFSLKIPFLKVLDRHILTRFLINFFSAFGIIIFIFIFHTIWLYIDEFAGKGISIWIILKFILFMLPNLIPIILPLTVVLSSIMTMGAFAESYEFAAMKASGVSLLRVLRILIIFMGILSFSVFFTTNNLHPITYRKAKDLRDNIQKKQPSLAISEGIFTNVEGYSIKVHKKTGENGQFLHDIIIHQNENGVNRTVIKAKEGELIGENKMENILQLVLKDGTYYREIINSQSNIRYPFMKTNFETYTMNIDISKMNEDVDFNQESDNSSYKTMNVNQLSYALDSLKNDYKLNITDFGESIYRRTGVSFLFETDYPEKKNQKDTIRTLTDLKKLYTEDYKRAQLYSLAKDNCSSILNNIDFKKDDIAFRNKIINIYSMTLSDKFALAFTCFVLFFVAAPLGAFIKKGGIGLPLVVAMGLFLSYYFLGMFIKNFAENGDISPIIAPWMPTFILLPLGIYLTYRIHNDKPIFEFGERFTKIKNILKRN